MNNIFLYGIVVVCAVTAFRGKDKFVKAAFTITLVADAFLLFGAERFYPFAVAVFAGAHVFYSARFTKDRRAMRAPTALWALSLLFPSLYIASGVYAVCLIFHAVSALKSRRVLCCAGAVLFVVCDICVALYNVSDAAWARDLWKYAWLFYAPALLFLALSGQGKTSQKVNVFVRL